MFGGSEGEFQDSFKTAWESLLLLANGHDTTRAKPGARVDRAKLRAIDLHWHDLRHEGACRLLADGVDIRIIQLMLGHADVKQTQRYLNITDEELRKAMTGVWERRRQLRAVGHRDAQETAVSRSRLSVICQSAGQRPLLGTRTPARVLKALPLALKRLSGCLEVARPAGFEPATFGSGEGNCEKTRGYLRQSGQCFRDSFGMV